MPKETREKISKALQNSDKLKASHGTKKFRDDVRKRLSIPIVVLKEDGEKFKEFPSMLACAEYFNYTVGNIKNACRFKRYIGKGRNYKYWVVRKDEYTST